MKNVKEFLRFLKDPHSQKIQRYRKRYQELDELLKVAIDLQDEEAYKSIQAEMREVFLEYLTALGIDSLYKFFPHIVLICLVSLKFKTITIPILNWEINTIITYLSLYFLFHLVLKPIVSLIKSRFRKVRQDNVQVNN